MFAMVRLVLCMMFNMSRLIFYDSQILRICETLLISRQCKPLLNSFFDLSRIHEFRVVHNG